MPLAAAVSAVPPDSCRQWAPSNSSRWANHVIFASQKILCRKAPDRGTTTPKPSAGKWQALCVRCCQECLLCLFSGAEGGNRSAVCRCGRAERCHRLGELRCRCGRGSAARRIGGDAVNHPRSANRAHRRTDEGILAGTVLVNLEIPGRILHQHLVLARRAERAKADNVKVTADRTNQVYR